MIDWIKNWGTAISIIISLFTFAFVIYKDFIKGPELKGVLSTVVMLKVAENNRGAIMEQIILNDLFSLRPSQQAMRFFNESQSLATAIKENNRDSAKIALLRYANERANKNDKIIYDATPETLAPFIGDRNIAISFYIPIDVVNAGRKTGNITSLILILKSKNNPANKWVFSCLSEIRPEEFMKFGPNQPFGTIIGRIFPGISIAPLSDQRIDGLYVPMDVVKNTIISKTSLLPDTYLVQLIGYNANNNKCLETNEASLDISIRQIVDVLNGGNLSINLSVEDHILKSL